MNVAELVGRTLSELGVGQVFTVVGSGNFEVTNALIAAGVPAVTARHEGGAATMADAYSRMSDLPAVVTTHQGCGLTNAITGIGEAAKSRTPLIVLTADVAGASVRSNFRIDQDALARSVGAVPERVYSAATAVEDVVRAYRAAVNDRRTVVISLPLDVQAQAITNPPAPLAAHVRGPQLRPSSESVERLVAAIHAAKRPVFIAGRGARSAGAELRALAEKAGALVATSAVANGLFVGEDFNLGISGGFSSPLAARLIRDADLIVGWGCALNMWTMRHGNLIGADATVVQVDLDDASLGANRPITFGVLGDTALTATDALTALHSAPRADDGYRTAEVRSEIAGSIRWNTEPFDDLSTATTIDPRLLSRELDELLPRDRIVSIDSGNFMGYPSTYLSVPDERGFCFTQAFQSIGLGLATGIGAAIAQPGRLPVVGAGDGGFMMSIAELDTAVRLHMPLVVIVYNDNGYGAEVHHFGESSDLQTVIFPETDIASIARGYGASAVTVRGVGDLAEVKAWVASSPTAPLVIDAKVSSDGGSWWLHEAFKGH